MDGLSSVASVIAVIQLAQTVGYTLKKFYQDVKHAREDISRLYLTITGFEGVLTIVQDLASSKNSFVSSRLLLDSSGPLQQCYVKLGTVQKKLNPRFTGRIGHAISALQLSFKKRIS
jgi:hypothetical protein